MLGVIPLQFADSESPPPAFTASECHHQRAGASTLRRAESMRIQQNPKHILGGGGKAPPGRAGIPKLGNLPKTRSFEASMIANLLEGTLAAPLLFCSDCSKSNDLGSYKHSLGPSAAGRAVAGFFLGFLFPLEPGTQVQKS